MRKPDLSHVRRALMVYVARGHEAGDALRGRSRGDWLVGPHLSREWVREQVAKAVGHLMAELDHMESSPGEAGAVDAETGVLHLALAAARVNMAVAGGILARILPEDPLIAKRAVKT